MPQPDSQQVLRVSMPLTNVSVAYTQQGTWIADRVFPLVSVQRQGDLYEVLTLAVPVTRTRGVHSTPRTRAGRKATSK